MADIPTIVDRIGELGALLEKMCKTYDMNEFYKLQKQWDEIVALNRLEDELNKESEVSNG